MCASVCVYTHSGTHIILILHLDCSQLVISSAATTEAKAFIVFETVIPQTVACQAPLSMGFSLSRQKYWSDRYYLLQEIFLTQE